MEKVEKHSRFRMLVQAIGFAFTNGYVQGFIKGKIYKGEAKKICVPGLNCYSCPGAVFSCPMGALQAAVGTRSYHLLLYVLGFIGLVGIFFGRAICGWGCPFGFVQDLLYKIPLGKKHKSLPGHRYLKYLKYVVLMLCICLLPLLFFRQIGGGEPLFCEYICPDGTLFGGLFMVAYHEHIRAAIGWKFYLKVSILGAVIVCATKVYRPFCKYVCPLGAMYALTNRFSLYRYEIDKEKCNGCGLCKKVCDMEVDVCQNPNSSECIRCGKCKKVCPQQAIFSTFDQLEKRIVGN